MAKQKTKVTERMYNILLGPVVTEKSTQASESNAVTFKVTGDATKPEIKKAVEGLYNVKVEKVNTLNTKGKVKRFRGHFGKRGDAKKAYVRLAEGQNIDLSTGI